MLDAALPHLQCAVQRALYVPSLAYRIAMVAEGALDATFIKPKLAGLGSGGGRPDPRRSRRRIAGADRRRPVYATADPRHGVLAAGSGPLLAAMVDGDRRRSRSALLEKVLLTAILF